MMLLNKSIKYCFKLSINYNLFFISQRNATLKFAKVLQSNREARMLNLRKDICDVYNEKRDNFDWNKFTKDMLVDRKLNKENMEIMLMSSLQMDNEDLKLDKRLIKSFIEFITSSPQIKARNHFISTHYCIFLSHFIDCIDDKSAEEIRRISDEVVEKYLDKTIIFTLAKDCIVSLSKTSRENCLHAIKSLDKVDVIKHDSQSMNTIISWAFKYGLNNQAINLIFSNPHIILDNINIKSILLHFDSTENKNQIISGFDYFKENFTVFEYNEIDLLKNIISKCGFNYTKAEINSDGICYKCNNKLTKITEKEFYDLKTQLENLVFNEKENRMLASLPEFKKELENFRNYIKVKTKNQPFDLVIDGLNAGYTTRTKVFPNKKKNARKFVVMKPVKDVDKQLVNVIYKNNILNTFKNILIIGRKHMANWPHFSNFLNVHKQVNCFLTLNETRDDTYILYSALQNPNTLVLSNDFFRDYKDLLDNKNMGHLFERWLVSHQILVDMESYHLYYPQKYDIRVNVNHNNLHIPFRVIEDIEENIYWLCCKR